MNVFESVRIALRALQSNKLRALLTVLGMTIGVGAVIAMMAVGAGAEAEVTSQIEGLGTNLLIVLPGTATRSGIRTQAGTAPTLTYEDGVAIASAPDLPVAAVAPETGTSAQVVYAGQNVQTRITATTPEYQYVRNFQVANGEFIGQHHLDNRSLVADLGANVARDLFGDQDPVGLTIKVSMAGRTGINFRVIGVMEAKGASGMSNQDDQIFVPITTMQQRLQVQRTARGTHNVSVINVQVSDESSREKAVAGIGDLLRARHRVAQDDFTVLSQADFIQIADQILGIMTLLLGSIAGISLVVGGIGIMNIMLVSVTERTREIGIRKAVGARRRDILTQFLVEAITVSLVGGALGMVLASVLCWVVSGIDVGGTRLQPIITVEAIMLAVGVSAAIGLFFGIYPAVRAARLNPIDALRYE